MVNQLWCIDFLTPSTPLIIPQRLPAFLESLLRLKNWCSIHARRSKYSLKHSIRFCGIFSKLKTEFYRSSKEWYCIFEIHQLWQPGFSRVYSNCFCSCSFEPEIIKICPSSPTMYSNNILNFQVSTTILNAHTKKSLETYRMQLVYMNSVVKDRFFLKVTCIHLQSIAFIIKEYENHQVITLFINWCDERK